MNAKLCDPSEGEMRAAWEVRRRYGWPHDYETSLANPVLHRIVKMHAQHLARVKQIDAIQDRRVEPSERIRIGPDTSLIDLPQYNGEKE